MEITQILEKSRSLTSKHYEVWFKRGIALVKPKGENQSKDSFMIAKIEAEKHGFIFKKDSNVIIDFKELSKTIKVNKDSYPYFVTHSATYYPNSVTSGDTIVDEVIKNFISRSQAGQTKYGKTLDREDLTLEQWITHAIEEGMDMVLYLTKIKKELKNAKL